MTTWRCSCGTQRPDCLTVCPKCADAPPYAPDPVQQARFRGIRRVMETGRYAEYHEAPAGWRRRGGAFVQEKP